jgi:hypothetical protein
MLLDSDVRDVAGGVAFRILDSKLANDALGGEDDNQDKGGADILRERNLDIDFTRSKAGAAFKVTCSGTGSLMNSGNVSTASGSANRTDSGIDSRINSGRVRRASKSLILGGWSTASWPCNRPAFEYCSNCSTKAFRFDGVPLSVLLLCQRTTDLLSLDLVFELPPI